MLSTVARTARTRVAAQARVSRRFLNAEAPKAPAGEPKKGGNGGVIGLLAVAAAAGGAYYYYSGEAAAPAAAPAAKSVDYKKISEEVADALESETHDDGSFGPVLVRLGWHSSGTFDKEKNDGGSDGAGMRFAPESKWGANAGLDKARAVIEAIKAKHPEITYSDLWILAANTAIEEMGGPHCAFRPGRSDKAEDCSPLPDGRLPDADGRGKNPADHLRDIFYRQGFNDQEIVALAGAHAIGRCHTENSGYWGPWTNAPTTFSNEFFRLLLDEKWTKKTKHEGKKWEGPEQFENPAGNLMMLPTDLSLVEDKEFRPWVEKYAKDEELFFKDFAAAWTKLTENGCKNLAAQPAL